MLSNVCQEPKTRYARQTMYTIKEAAARTGVPIALLRAWERRYGVVAPSRTAAGYRLYDEAAVDRLRTMRRLVGDGWQPSAAAAAILAGTAPTAPAIADEPAAIAVTARDAGGPSASATASRSPDQPDPIRAFVDAAAELDTRGLEQVLDAMFAAGTFEHVADRLILPALTALGEAWANARVSVAGEHAASHAVLRRLAAAFQAAGRAVSAGDAVLVGLPPGARHELAALAFAVAGRRAGLPIVYLGADLPVADWVAAARNSRPRAAVIGVPTAADVDTGVAVGEALARLRPRVLIAVGGHAAGPTATRLAAATPAGGRRRTGPIVLPDRLSAAVDALASALAADRPRRPTPA
jgi:methanogenic corrinoid protein MtbC1